jgi:polysaccharide pyruvyl transferase WcaK-like protein
MAKPYNTIGLLDHMGFGNLGDAAIHESFIHNITSRLPKARLIAFSQNPDDTRQRHNIAAYPIRRSCPALHKKKPQGAKKSSEGSQLTFLRKRCHMICAIAERLGNAGRELAHLVRSYRVVRSLDLLIVSGGGQLCDLWWDQPYNVFKFCMLAKLSNKPVFLIGVGADLLRGTLSKAFARWTVRLSDYVCFRDVESQEVMRSLGVKTQTHVCPDPAYAINLPDIKLIQPLAESRLIVGINPMGFCDSRTWPRQDAAVYNNYLDSVAYLSSWLLSQNYDIELFSTDAGVDRYAIDDLRDKLLATDSPDAARRVTCSSARNLDELLCQMARFEFVVTSKFHGVVFSHLLARPVIALSYMPKIDFLMRTVGHERYCLDIEHCDGSALVVAFMCLARSADDVKRVSRGVAADYRDRLEGEFDKLFVLLSR